MERKYQKKARSSALCISCFDVLGVSFFLFFFFWFQYVSTCAMVVFILDLSMLGGLCTYLDEGESRGSAVCVLEI